MKTSEAIGTHRIQKIATTLIRPTYRSDLGVVNREMLMHGIETEIIEADLDLLPI